MAGFTDYLEAALLDHILGGPDYERPSSVYVALSTTAPDDDGSGFTEPAGGGYARVAVTNNATNWPAAEGDPTTKSNGDVIAFPQATDAWGTVTHFGIFDDTTGGNLLMSGPLDNPREVLFGDLVSFLAGEIKVTLD